MKTKIILLGMIMNTMWVLGCAKESGDGNSSTTSSPYLSVSSGPYVPATTGVGESPGLNADNTYQYGSTATLTPVNLATMMEYTGHTLNDPQTIQINLNLVQYGSDPNGNPSFGGTTTISYVDSGTQYVEYFTGGDSEQAAQFNLIFPFQGRQVFHGFFEDFLGGIIVVIDPQEGSTGLGDGASGGEISGSVWFKNFPVSYAPHPPTYCWFVSIGPYDCQSWPVNNSVNTYENVNPNNGYIQLGTFSGLGINAAFNGVANFQ